jgi:hypothetical protein
MWPVGNETYFLAKNPPDVIDGLVSAEDQGFGVVDVELHQRDVELRADLVDDQQSPEQEKRSN